MNCGASLVGPKCSSEVEGSLKTWAMGKDLLPGMSRIRKSIDHLTTLLHHSTYIDHMLRMYSTYNDDMDVNTVCMTLCGLL